MKMKGWMKDGWINNWVNENERMDEGWMNQ